ncbi:serine hydrolase domain-containing protein [Rheinheimera faecalis]|uniref:serine hydrolase domain-containing protein n=1 Tax=Rheinheimera faecalis TaxID=2901141 RepID=UPI001E52E195|nr:serine hydrolase [Rheinheimera faecalis]
MKRTLLVAIKILLSLGLLFAATHHLTAQALAAESKPIHTDSQQKLSGKIIFSTTAKAIESYQATELIQRFELNSTKSLYFNAVLDQPLTAYLQELAPELSAEEVNKIGNYQFTFYVDGSVVYTENLNLAAGLSTEKSSHKVLMKPFFSEASEDSWGRFLWMRFMHFGGEQAMTEGVHTLKIEIRPYVKTADIKIGNLIATGEISVQVVKPKATEQQIAIQPIQATHDWIISKDSYNKDLIRAMNKKIAEKDFKDISSVVVIKDGALLLEEYFNGSERASLHDPRSVGKSFASTMLGIAIAEGFIQSERQSLSEFYPLKNYQNYSTQKANVSLKDLMTMTSGFAGDDSDSASQGNEENMYPTPDWVKFTLDLPMQNPTSSAKEWSYFTAGVVILGDVLHQKIPDGLEAYADKKLFAPLGITEYQWQYTPQKVANTAGGIRLRALDFAKYGQLYKNGGSWGKQQIIPADWVKASLAEQVARTEQKDGGHYGYLFWNDRIQSGQQSFEVAYASGNGGNKIFIFKDIPLVIVITAKAYNKAYGHPQVAQMISDYLLPAILH